MWVLPHQATTSNILVTSSRPSPETTHSTKSNDESRCNHHLVLHHVKYSRLRGNCLTQHTSKSPDMSKIMSSTSITQTHTQLYKATHHAVSHSPTNTLLQILAYLLLLLANNCKSLSSKIPKSRPQSLPIQLTILPHTRVTVMSSSNNNNDDSSRMMDSPSGLDTFFNQKILGNKNYRTSEASPCVSIRRKLTA